MSDLNIPKVGKVDKKIVIPIVVAAAGYIGYRYWIAQSAPAEDPTATSDFADGGTEPTYVGPVAGNPAGQYDGDGSNPPSTDSYGFTGTTNAQWTQYVSTQLSQSDSWSYTSIVEALGNYLGGQPLSDAQQAIARAAIAIGGYPPVGSHVIVPGGNTAITIAPAGLKVASTTPTTATLTYSAVAGATGYQAYRGTGTNVGSSNGTSLTVSGLSPNTSYTFTVKAVSGSGATGPSSNSATAKTKGVSVGKPNTPRATAITKTSAHVTTGKVTNADGYDWWINGVAHGHSDAPAYTVTGLKSRTSYRLQVRATVIGGPGSAVSNIHTFKTK